MKATLLLKNIAHLYTCNAEQRVYEHAYIACHHQWIMALGTGEWKGLTDDATRILDARGECVVPAFIESRHAMPESRRFHDTLRNENEILHQMQQAGILTVMTEAGRIQRRTLNQDVFRSRDETFARACFGQKVLPEKPFVLSLCKPGRNTSFMPAAFYLKHMNGAAASDLLMAMTAWPAQANGMKDRGILEKGYLADFLVLRVADIEDFFDRADTEEIHRMVKNGIPIYPEIMRC